MDSDFDNNKKLVFEANRRRLALECSPSQSHFRVFAFLIVEDSKGTYHQIEGTNSEPGYIGGSICAERSAILRLRFLHGPKLKKVVIVSDHREPILPGALCREYMTSVASENLDIIMGNCDGDKIATCKLSELFPQPYLYRTVGRDEVLSLAQEYSAVIDDPSTTESEWGRVFTTAKALTSGDKAVALHPLKLAAAVSFSDGTIEGAWQLKGSEYGCSLDPVSQLAGIMLRRCSSNSFVSCSSTSVGTSISICPSCGCCKDCISNDSASNSTSSSTFAAAPADKIGSETDDARSDAQQRPPARPLLLVMVDQFGVAHAPFAQARALLGEYGFGDVLVGIHDINGRFVTVTAASLLPSPPGCTLLSHDNF